MGAMTLPNPGREFRIEALLGLGVAGLVFALFHFQGNASNVAMEGRSLFLWIGRQWAETDGAFSHGWLMPLVSLGIVWMKRAGLAAAPKRVSVLGFALALLCLLLHWMALRAQQPRLSLVALAGLTWTIPFFLYGWPTAKILAFPCAYLLLCFTSYFLVSMTLTLRLVASAISTGVLNGIGIHAQRAGTAVFTSAGGGFNFDVADPCSGLRSLVVMTALGAPYAYLVMDSAWRKWVLFLASIPLAMLANVVRIVTIALAAQVVNADFAMTLYHDYSGYLIFGAATALLVTTGRLLQMQPREAMRRCVAKG